MAVAVVQQDNCWMCEARFRKIMPVIDNLLNSHQVGEILGLHPKVVERKAKQGEIPGFKIGKFWRYRTGELDAWITAQLQSSRQACRMETSF